MLLQRHHPCHVGKIDTEYFKKPSLGVAEMLLGQMLYEDPGIFCEVDVQVAEKFLVSDIDVISF